ncbi:sulfatase family protein [Lewinella cohaerens]|uniref:sulfatase family protein n=1 Tax=Lewinella cohaerens TaxID=70995 RepID=UPI000367EDDB|nr:sulfatase-like hydrolase/transferase [Lewinella cohaerens]
MKQIYYLFFVGAFSLGNMGCSNSSPVKKSSDSPNIIFILADDLGFGDLACYGHPYAKTPHLDQLADEGIMLTRAYSAGIVCAPSRQAFMTGKYPVTHQNNADESGFDDETTITDLLSAKGYLTGHFGKWHMGKKGLLSDPPYGIKVIGKERGKRQGPEGKDVEIFSEAITFINSAVDDQPFYLNIWTRATHFPITDIPAFSSLFDSVAVDENYFSSSFRREKIQKVKAAGLSIDSLMRRYLAEVYALDYQVGRIMKALDDAGLQENTIIIFASDQGPAEIDLDSQDKEERYSSLGSSGTLRGGKKGTLEGGIRIPFIVRWPERIPIGRLDSTSVFSGVDYLPTLCKLAGINFDEGQISGIDRSSVWLGAPSARKEPLFWKTAISSPSTTILEGSWKFTEINKKEHYLYNLETDPTEQINLSKQYPEKLNSLSEQIQAWENENIK